MPSLARLRNRNTIQNVEEWDGAVATSYKRGDGTSENPYVISNGSVIAVNEGQCMIIVDQGKVVEFCADAGEFMYDTSSEPSLLCGDLGENIKNTFRGLTKVQ